MTIFCKAINRWSWWGVRIKRRLERLNYEQGMLRERIEEIKKEKKTGKKSPGRLKYELVALEMRRQEIKKEIEHLLRTCKHTYSGGKNAYERRKN